MKTTKKSIHGHMNSAAKKGGRGQHTMAQVVHGQMRKAARSGGHGSQTMANPMDDDNPDTGEQDPGSDLSMGEQCC